LEASALTHASRRGLLARRSPLLKLQGDEKLVAMARGGDPGAFETMVDRYQGRLLGFCRQMLGSTEDAEDVLQEVFVNAYKAMMADEREINLRPWLYRIARNRCLNHLRKPKADAQETMDMVPEVDAASTAEKVHNREEFRQILSDVNKLPETQRAALLLREMDALSYEEIAAAMETTVPSVKSLLVRARISLAEASQARLLTCGEVHVELSEAAEGLRKVSAPVRRHVRECEECADFRSQIRSNEKQLAALFPVAPLIAFKAFILSKLGLGGAGAGAGGAATGAGAGAGALGGAGAGAIGGVGAAAALGGGGAAGGIGAALGTKAVAGVVTAAVLTAGAVEVRHTTSTTPVASSSSAPSAQVQAIDKSHTSSPQIVANQPAPAVEPVPAPPVPVEPVEAPPVPEPVAAAPQEPADPAPAPVPIVAAEEGEAAAGSASGEEATPESEAINAAKPSTTVPGAHGGSGTVVVTVSSKPPPPPASEPVPTASPEASTPPPSPPPAVEVPVTVPVPMPVPVPVVPPVTTPAPDPAPPADEAAAE
jgi:RNA polymerase sigma factor (sigma-70 family)